MRECFDAIIVGAGPAGAAAALALTGAGFSCALVDRAPLEPDARPDLRTSALLDPSIDFLSRLGLWPELERVATPLETLRVIDAGLERAGALSRDFTARDAGLEAFGWNIANSDLKRALYARLADDPQAAVIAPATVLTLTRRESEALATLETGEGRRQLRARALSSRPTGETRRCARKQAFRRGGSTAAIMRPCACCAIMKRIATSP